MSLLITPTKPDDITRLVCPQCGEKVRGVGLLKGSSVSGLTFTCKRCRHLWQVTTTK